MYCKINMQSFCDDTSTVASPASMDAELYDHMIVTLVVCKTGMHHSFVKKLRKPAGWLSDSYGRDKSMRRQFKCMWHNFQLSRRRLHRQTAQCNVIIYRDKA